MNSRLLAGGLVLEVLALVPLPLSLSSKLCLGYICSDRRSLGFGRIGSGSLRTFCKNWDDRPGCGQARGCKLHFSRLVPICHRRVLHRLLRGFEYMCWSVGSKLSGAYSVRPGSWIPLLHWVFYPRPSGLYANILADLVLPKRESIGSYVA